ncbi:MAG: hypothetical protein ACXWU1_13325 [Allosphingosinicella sp.]
MTLSGNSNDEAYARIVADVCRDRPDRHVEELRRLAASGHVESMTLLAVLLGDVDGASHRAEIVALNERAFALGSPVAAENMAIQYEQWNEPFMARLWRSRATS